MKSKYEDLSETVDPEGWSRWVTPAPIYKMACCDCGLVHEMRYRIDDGELEVAFRRNNRATAQVRRHREH